MEASLVAAIDAIGIERKRTRQQRPAAAHTHKGYEILVFLGGSVSFRIAGSDYPLRRGDCLVIRSDEQHHSVFSKTSYERLSIRFDPAIVRYLAPLGGDLLACFDERPAGRDNRIPLNNRQTNSLLDRCQLMEDERLDALTRHQGPCARLHHLLGILLLLDAAHRNSEAARRRDVGPLITACLELMEQGLDDPDLRMTDIARTLGCSPNHLSRRFQQEIGRGFRDHLLHRRTAKAKHLLRTGASVTEACMACGFNDYANFIKRFRQRTGHSPGAFRKAHRPFSA